MRLIIARLKPSVPVLVLLSLMANTGLGHAETFRITVTDWCPFHCIEGEDRGFVMDTVDAAFKSQGHDVEFVPLPWLRALDATRNGETDGSLAPNSSEAPDFIYPAHPVANPQMCFFTGSDHSWTYIGPESLGAIRFGFLDSIYYPGIMDYIDEHRGSDRIQPILGEKYVSTNFLKIDHGRMDALVEDKHVAYYYIKQRGIDPTTYRRAGCLKAEAAYLGLTPQRPEKSAKLASIYDAGFEAIRANGELTTILHSYGIDDATPLN